MILRWHPYGAERGCVRANPVKRGMFRLFGWPQIGPRIRFWYLLDAIGDSQPRRILEAGCGWGHMLFGLKRRFPSAELTGVEQDPGELGLELRIIQATGLQAVRLVEATLPDLPVRGRFDLAIVGDVLEYIADDVEVLRRLRDVLEPSGRLIVHVPSRISSQRRYLPVSHAIAGHVRPEYTREEILAKVRAAGFEAQRVRVTFGPWGMLAWEAGRLAERVPLLGSALFPVLLALARLDLCGTWKDGGGYLIVATPRETEHG